MVKRSFPVLRVFSAVCQEMHFSRPDDVLHLVQPVLSKIIQRLEAEVGVPLLLRPPAGSS